MVPEQSWVDVRKKRQHKSACFCLKASKDVNEILGKKDMGEKLPSRPNYRRGLEWS
jgi:hypothetical protein